MKESSAWLLVLMAGVLEVAFAVGLKSSSGFDRPWIMSATLAALIGSLVLLSFALKHLPVGTAYAVWTGIGAAGTAIVGVSFLGDAATASRVACISFIVAGVVGLRVVS